tara:strand:+ start:200 stop:418 length:219 start_codon:yes stop_codon:yes gene_type:complete
MEKTETGYNIDTYDSGVLHFVIGCEYSAIATNGESNVTGELVEIPKIALGGVALWNKKLGYININEKTLRYL